MLGGMPTILIDSYWQQSKDFVSHPVSLPVMCQMGAAGLRRQRSVCTDSDTMRGGRV